MKTKRMHAAPFHVNDGVSYFLMVWTIACYLWLFVILIPAGVSANDDLKCTVEENLSSAAAVLLLVEQPPDSRSLMKSVRLAGSDIVSVKALWISNKSSNKQVNSWLYKLTEQSDAPIVCGYAENDGVGILIAAPRGGSLAPITRESMVVRGSLAQNFYNPEVVISFGDKEIRRFSVEDQQLKRGFSLIKGLPLPIHIQLIANGLAGPRPIAERIIPRTYGLPVPMESNAIKLSSKKNKQKNGEKPNSLPSRSDWIDRLNRFRLSRGMLSLRKHRLLQEVASEYASTISRSGRVFHQSSIKNNPEMRLAVAGVHARLVGETIACSEREDTAFRALIRSPSHLMAILDNRFTDTGIGLAMSQSGRVCMVILLAAWPRFVGRVNLSSLHSPR